MTNLAFVLQTQVNYICFFYLFFNFKIINIFLDSFCLWIKTKNLLDDFKNFTHLMDFSNYPKDHKLFNFSKKNALFHLKDETEGNKIIKQFIGLAPKQYAFSFLCKDGRKIEKKCHKGLSKASIKHQLFFKDYLDALFNLKNMSKPGFNFISKDHQIHTVYHRKKLVNSFYDKRYLLNCKICTKPYGSSYIEKHKDKRIRCKK